MYKAAFIGCDKYLTEAAKELGFFNAVPDENGNIDADIIVLGEKKQKKTIKAIKGGTVICPQKTNIKVPLQFNAAISCGMDSRATISFSSIDEENAMAAVNRNIETLGGRVVECQELKVRFNKNLSVYENLLLCGLGILSEKL